MGFVQGNTLVRAKDGGGLEVSVNNGVSWTSVGASTTYAGQSWLNTQLGRVDAALGSASGGYAWTDFALGAEFTASGIAAVGATVDGGVMAWTPGTTIGSVRLSGPVKLVANHRTNGWYYSVRMRFVDTPDANTRFVFGPTDGAANAISWILDGSVSLTTPFVQVFTGSAVQNPNLTLTGAAIGGGVVVGTWYDFALSCDATTVTAWLNGVSVATRVDVANLAAVALYLNIDHTPGAGSKKVEVDAMFTGFKRSP